MLRPTLAIVAFAGLACAPAPNAHVDEPVALFTPRWVFEPWISKDISTGPDMRDFIQGFVDRDIPVGVAVLDSPWETNYNTFVPNETRYPAFKQYVADLRAKNIRTVLWTTQMVNEESFDIEQGGDTYPGPAANFVEGQEKKFFVNGGKTALWWKGTGAGVDFFNADARDWWHRAQQLVLDDGVAGFKLDFGEEYLGLDGVDTKAGKKSLQEYSEAYYRDFLENGVRERTSQEFVIMPRPFDESYGFPPRFYARPGDAPAAWVGDQTRDWAGMQTALDHIFESAHAGYAVLGSDIGGYLDALDGTDIPFDLDVFHAWTAMSALTPLFQLHGRANLAPWTVPVTDQTAIDDTVAQYRYWATLHHALSKFFFSLTREAQLQTPFRAKPNAGAQSVLHVVGDDKSAWSNDYRYFIGDALFAAPLVAPGRARTVALPSREDGAQYVDWWNLGGDAFAGGTTVSFTAPTTREIPLYVVAGAIIPLVVDSDATGFAPASDAHAFDNALTVLCFPGPSSTSFTLHEDDDSTGTIEMSDGHVKLDGINGRVILRVRSSASSVTVNGKSAALANDQASLATGAAASYFVDAASRAVWVGVPDGASADVAIR